MPTRPAPTNSTSNGPRRDAGGRALWKSSLLPVASTLLLLFACLTVTPSGASVEEERSEVHVQARLLVRASCELSETRVEREEFARDGGHLARMRGRAAFFSGMVTGHRLPNGLCAPLIC